MAVEAMSAILNLDVSDATPAQRREMLAAAARKGDLALLQSIVAHDKEVLKRSGETAMAEACGEGHLEVARWLQAQGVKIDGFFFDDENPGVTIAQYPLYRAVDALRWPVVHWLLSQGAKISHQPRLLGNLVNADMELFTHVLATLPYIAAANKPEGDRDREESIHASAVMAALRVVTYNDYLPYAEALMQAGLDPAIIFEDTLQHNESFKILRALYVAGFEPTAQQLARQETALVMEMSKEKTGEVKKLVKAWKHPAPLQPVADELRALCANALADTPGVWLRDTPMPVVVALTRGGHFMADVAPLLPKHGAALLLQRCHYGVSPADILAGRGELQQVFSAEIWRGHEAEARQLYQQLPAHLQAQVDFSLLSAALRQETLRDQSTARKFKLGGPKP